MARVDLYVRNSMWTVGEDWFLDSFFSTVAYQLEREGWGTRFPALLKELYGGRLDAGRTGAGLEELVTIRSELAQLEPQARVFEYDDPNKPTPWAVPPGAKTLAQCFLTASGENLLDVLHEALEAARESGSDLEIRPFAGAGTYSHYVTGER